VRLKTVNALEAQKILFDWLYSAADSEVAGELLLLTPEDLRQFFLPAPSLVDALRHSLARLLGDIEVRSVQRGIIQLPISVFILTLAAYNCQVVNLGVRSDKEIISWNDALLDMIPPAREMDVILAYHAVLNHVTIDFGVRADWQKKLKAGLLERSPLTGLVCLDEHMPVIFAELTAEMLPGWQRLDQSSSSPWAGVEEWLGIVVMLLQEKSMERWLRQSWLAMPETRASCRNLGLLFEALRRRGGLENILLEFYEAYDYFGRQATADGKGENSLWPVLSLAARLLAADSQTVGPEAARFLNRYGHEYLLKFRPLIEIIIARRGIPAEYRALSRELVHVYLRPLLDYVAEGTGQRLVFGQLQFSGV
jgi:hypothetical protein